MFYKQVVYCQQLTNNLDVNAKYKTQMFRLKVDYKTFYSKTEIKYDNERRFDKHINLTNALLSLQTLLICKFIRKITNNYLTHDIEFFR